MTDFSDPNAQPFFFEGGDHAVLLVHGFTATPGTLRLLGEGLRDNGFTVNGILLPGHGTSMEDMKKYSWQDWLQAVKMTAQEMKKKYRYLTVGGLSMGGILSLLMAEQMEMTSCVSISAPIHASNKMLPFAGLMAPFVPMIHYRPDHGERAKVVDPRYDFGYTGFPTKSGYDLNTLMKQARNNLFAVTCPLLVVQSHNDMTIRQDSADIIMQRAQSQNKQMLWLDKAPHVCTLSDENPKIVKKMTEFLRETEK